MAKQYSLPLEFYARRAELYEKIGACVLIDPKLCPSRVSLPRDRIVDGDLIKLLALAATKLSAYSLAIAVRRACGKRYVAKLLSRVLLDSDGAAFVWLIDWYVAQLAELERVASKFEQTALELIALREAAQNEPIPKQ